MNEEKLYAFEQQFFTVILMVSTLWLCSSPINQTGTNKDDFDSDLNSGFFKCHVSLYKFLLFEMQNLKNCPDVCRIRLSEGFNFAASGEGIINMVIELPMKVKNSRTNCTPKLFLCDPDLVQLSFICVFRECQETWTEKATLVLFSISYFPLTLPQLRTGKPGSNRSLEQDTLLGWSFY